MKFLVTNYSCLQNPPTDPRSLCPLSSTEFVDPPTPEQNSWLRHWEGKKREVQGKIMKQKSNRNTRRISKRERERERNGKRRCTKHKRSRITTAGHLTTVTAGLQVRKKHDWWPTSTFLCVDAATWTKPIKHHNCGGRHASTTFRGVIYRWRNKQCRSGHRHLLNARSQS